MKRLGIFVVFCGLLFSNSLFSQSLDGSWQLQDYADPGGVETMTFVSNLFMNGTSNINTGQFSMINGKYSVTEGIITFTPQGRDPFSFKLTWINSDKFKISDKSGGYLIYYRIAPAYNVPVVPSGGYTPGTYTPTPSSSPQRCWPCTGTGKCKVCNGKGTIGTIPATTCTACYGSGVCKFCSGTGIFKGN